MSNIKKITKVKPSFTVVNFANSNQSLHRLPKGINALSFRLAVNRYNAGGLVTGERRIPIMLVRRTDEQTGLYYLAREVGV